MRLSLLTAFVALTVQGTILEDPTFNSNPVSHGWALNIDEHAQNGPAGLVGQLPLTDNGHERDMGAALAASATGSVRSFLPAIQLDLQNELVELLSTLQVQFYEPWLGTWPKAIDWTAAVLNTHLLASLSTLSSSVNRTNDPPLSQYTRDLENNVTGWLSESIAYYFAEDAFGIRQEAFDDMQWVVLGWLEGIKFIRLQNYLHALQMDTVQKSDGGQTVKNAPQSSYWATTWVSAWAHRARIFYDIVSSAWNQDGLCGGGLTWNPRLQPYKNAVTNTQFVSSSVGMYLYHPGDNNSSPFLDARDQKQAMQAAVPKMDSSCPESVGATFSGLKPHDPRLLNNAVKEYDWLQAVKMQNAAGLYVDGYHISASNRINRTLAGKPEQCDDRNEMVYSYNQGIVLSGLRHLWEATGNHTYLVDGHQLVSDVLAATGYDSPLRSDGLALRDEMLAQQVHGEWTTPLRKSSKPPLALGSHGILTEFCDPSGACSQDGQTFKSVFFHHLALFCAPLPLSLSDPRIVPGISHIADPTLASLHRSSCKSYAPWVARNAKAALSTKSSDKGIVGSWWGAGFQEGLVEWRLPANASDWRNTGVNTSMQTVQCRLPDSNDRGRGRTAESHAGGIAVVRCLSELVRLFA